MFETTTLTLKKNGEPFLDLACKISIIETCFLKKLAENTAKMGPKRAALNVPGQK